MNIVFLSSGLSVEQYKLYMGQQYSHQYLISKSLVSNGGNSAMVCGFSNFLNFLVLLSFFLFQFQAFKKEMMVLKLQLQ